MNDWYQRMVDTLQLNGKGERTQQAYTRSVRMLSQFYDKTPDLISEPELQEYFLHRKNVNHWSPKTMRICYCGIRFFYVNVLERDWLKGDPPRCAWAADSVAPTLCSVGNLRRKALNLSKLYRWNFTWRRFTAPI
jgi:hypothetical protein